MTADLEGKMWAALVEEGDRTGRFVPGQHIASVCGVDVEEVHRVHRRWVADGRVIKVDTTSGPQYSAAPGRGPGR